MVILNSDFQSWFNSDWIIVSELVLFIPDYVLKFVHVQTWGCLSIGVDLAAVGPVQHQLHYAWVIAGAAIFQDTGVLHLLLQFHYVWVYTVDVFEGNDVLLTGWHLILVDYVLVFFLYHLN